MRLLRKYGTWPTWFSLVLEIVLAKPLISQGQHLKLLGTKKHQPIHPKVNLLTLFCSRKKKTSLQNPCSVLGTAIKNTCHFSKNRGTFLIKGMQIHCSMMKRSSYNSFQNNAKEVCFWITFTFQPDISTLSYWWPGAVLKGNFTPSSLEGDATRTFLLLQKDALGKRLVTLLKN